MESSAILTKALGVPPVVESYTSTSTTPTVWISDGASITTTDSFTTSFTKTLTPGSKATELLGLGSPPLTDGICYPVADGHGPKPAHDTTRAFLEFGDFTKLALSAPTPNNYTRVYVDKHAASFSPENYMQWLELKSYDTVECSTQCDDMPTCRGFNIYFERKPTLQLGPNCPTSPSSTSIKCAFFSAKLDKSDATNSGFLERDFEHVIAGSNAYNKHGIGAAKSMAASTVGSATLLLVTSVTVLIGGTWMFIDMVDTTARGGLADE